MGHIINPITHRLGRNIFWTSNWVHYYSFRNFSYLFGTDFQFLILIEWLIYFSFRKKRERPGLYGCRSWTGFMREFGSFKIFKTAKAIHLILYLYLEQLNEPLYQTLRTRSRKKSFLEYMVLKQQMLRQKKRFKTNRFVKSKAYFEMFLSLYKNIIFTSYSLHFHLDTGKKFRFLNFKKNWLFLFFRFRFNRGAELFKSHYRFKVARYRVMGQIPSLPRIFIFQKLKKITQYIGVPRVTRAFARAKINRYFRVKPRTRFRKRRKKFYQRIFHFHRYRPLYSASFSFTRKLKLVQNKSSVIPASNNFLFHRQFKENSYHQYLKSQFFFFFFRRTLRRIFSRMFFRRRRRRKYPAFFSNTKFKRPFRIKNPRFIFASRIKSHWRFVKRKCIKKRLKKKFSKVRFKLKTSKKKLISPNKFINYVNYKRLKKFPYFQSRKIRFRFRRLRSKLRIRQFRILRRLLFFKYRKKLKQFRRQLRIPFVKNIIIKHKPLRIFKTPLKFKIAELNSVLQSNDLPTNLNSKIDLKPYSLTKSIRTYVNLFLKKKHSNLKLNNIMQPQFSSKLLSLKRSFNFFSRVLLYEKHKLKKGLLRITLKHLFSKNSKISFLGSRNLFQYFPKFYKTLLKFSKLFLFSKYTKTPHNFFFHSKQLIFPFYLSRIKHSIRSFFFFLRPTFFFKSIGLKLLHFTRYKLKKTSSVNIYLLKKRKLRKNFLRRFPLFSVFKSRLNIKKVRNRNFLFSVKSSFGFIRKFLNEKRNWPIKRMKLYVKFSEKFLNISFKNVRYKSTYFDKNSNYFYQNTNRVSHFLHFLKKKLIYKPQARYFFFINKLILFPFKLKFFFRRLQSKIFRKSFLVSNLSNFHPVSFSRYLQFCKFPDKLITRSSRKSKFKTFLKFASFFSSAGNSNYMAKYSSKIFKNSFSPKINQIFGFSFLSQIYKRTLLLSNFSTPQITILKGSQVFNHYTKLRSQNLITFNKKNTSNLQFQNSVKFSLSNFQKTLLFFKTPKPFKFFFPKLKRFDPIPYAAFMLNYETPVLSKFFFYPSSNKSYVISPALFFRFRQRKFRKLIFKKAVFNQLFKKKPTIYLLKKKLYIRNFFLTINFLSRKKIFSEISQNKFKQTFRIKYKKRLLNFLKIHFYKFRDNSTWGKRRRVKFYKFSRTYFKKFNSNNIFFFYKYFSSFYNFKRFQFYRFIFGDRGRSSSILNFKHFALKTLFSMTSSIKFPTLILIARRARLRFKRKKLKYFFNYIKPVKGLFTIARALKFMFKYTLRLKKKASFRLRRAHRRERMRILNDFVKERQLEEYLNSLTADELQKYQHRQDKKEKKRLRRAAKVEELKLKLWIHQQKFLRRQFRSVLKFKEEMKQKVLKKIFQKTYLLLFNKYTKSFLKKFVKFCNRPSIENPSKELLDSVNIFCSPLLDLDDVCIHAKLINLKLYYQFQQIPFFFSLSFNLQKSSKNFFFFLKKNINIRSKLWNLLKSTSNFLNFFNPNSVYSKFFCFNDYTNSNLLFSHKNTFKKPKINTVLTSVDFYQKILPELFSYRKFKKQSKFISYSFGRCLSQIWFRTFFIPVPSKRKGFIFYSDYKSTFKEKFLAKNHQFTKKKDELKRFAFLSKFLSSNFRKYFSSFFLSKKSNILNDLSAFSSRKNALQFFLFFPKLDGKLLNKKKFEAYADSVFNRISFKYNFLNVTYFPKIQSADLIENTPEFSYNIKPKTESHEKFELTSQFYQRISQFLKKKSSIFFMYSSGLLNTLKFPIRKKTRNFSFNKKDSAHILKDDRFDSFLSFIKGPDPFNLNAAIEKQKQSSQKSIEPSQSINLSTVNTKSDLKTEKSISNTTESKNSFKSVVSQFADNSKNNESTKSITPQAILLSTDSKNLNFFFVNHFFKKPWRNLKVITRSFKLNYLTQKIINPVIKCFKYNFVNYFRLRVRKNSRTKKQFLQGLRALPILPTFRYAALRSFQKYSAFFIKKSNFGKLINNKLRTVKLKGTQFHELLLKLTARFRRKKKYYRRLSTFVKLRNGFKFRRLRDFKSSSPIYRTKQLARKPKRRTQVKRREFSLKIYLRKRRRFFRRRRVKIKSYTVWLSTEKYLEQLIKRKTRKYKKLRKRVGFYLRAPISYTLRPSVPFFNFSKKKRNFFLKRAFNQIFSQSFFLIKRNVKIKFLKSFLPHFYLNFFRYLNKTRSFSFFNKSVNRGSFISKSLVLKPLLFAFKSNLSSAASLSSFFSLVPKLKTNFALKFSSQKLIYERSSKPFIFLKLFQYKSLINRSRYFRKIFFKSSFKYSILKFSGFTLKKRVNRFQKTNLKKLLLRRVLFQTKVKISRPFFLKRKIFKNFPISRIVARNFFVKPLFRLTTYSQRTFFLFNKLLLISSSLNYFFKQSALNKKVKKKDFKFLLQKNNYFLKILYTKNKSLSTSFFLKNNLKFGWRLSKEIRVPNYFKHNFSALHIFSKRFKIDKRRILKINSTINLQRRKIPYLTNSVLKNPRNFLRIGLVTPHLSKLLLNYYFFKNINSAFFSKKFILPVFPLINFKFKKNKKYFNFFLKKKFSKNYLSLKKNKLISKLKLLPTIHRNPYIYFSISSKLKKFFFRIFSTNLKNKKSKFHKKKFRRSFRKLKIKTRLSKIYLKQNTQILLKLFPLKSRHTFFFKDLSRVANHVQHFDYYKHSRKRRFFKNYLKKQKRKKSNILNIFFKTLPLEVKRSFSFKFFRLISFHFFKKFPLIFSLKPGNKLAKTTVRILKKASNLLFKQNQISQPNIKLNAYRKKKKIEYNLLKAELSTISELLTCNFFPTSLMKSKLKLRTQYKPITRTIFFRKIQRKFSKQFKKKLFLKLIRSNKFNASSRFKNAFYSSFFFKNHFFLPNFTSKSDIVSFNSRLFIYRKKFDFKFYQLQSKVSFLNFSNKDSKYSQLNIHSYKKTNKYLKQTQKLNSFRFKLTPSKISHKTINFDLFYKQLKTKFANVRKKNVINFYFKLPHIFFYKSLNLLPSFKPVNIFNPIFFALSRPRFKKDFINFIKCVERFFFNKTKKLNIKSFNINRLELRRRISLKNVILNQRRVFQKFFFYSKNSYVPYNFGSTKIIHLLRKNTRSSLNFSSLFFKLFFTNTAKRKKIRIRYRPFRKFKKYTYFKVRRRRKSKFKKKNKIKMKIKLFQLKKKLKKRKFFRKLFKKLGSKRFSSKGPRILSGRLFNKSSRIKSRFTRYAFKRAFPKFKMRVRRHSRYIRWVFGLRKFKNNLNLRNNRHYLTQKIITDTQLVSNLFLKRISYTPYLSIRANHTNFKFKKVLSFLIYKQMKKSTFENLLRKFTYNKFILQKIKREVTPGFLNLTKPPMTILPLKYISKSLQFNFFISSFFKHKQKTEVKLNSKKNLKIFFKLKNLNKSLRKWSFLLLPPIIDSSKMSLNKIDSFFFFYQSHLMSKFYLYKKQFSPKIAFYNSNISNKFTINKSGITSLKLYKTFIPLKHKILKNLIVDQKRVSSEFNRKLIFFDFKRQLILSNINKNTVNIRKFFFPKKKKITNKYRAISKFNRGSLVKMNKQFSITKIKRRNLKSGFPELLLYNNSIMKELDTNSGSLNRKIFFFKKTYFFLPRVIPLLNFSFKSNSSSILNTNFFRSMSKNLMKSTWAHNKFSSTFSIFLKSLLRYISLKSFNFPRTTSRSNFYYIKSLQLPSIFFASHNFLINASTNLANKLNFLKITKFQLNYTSQNKKMEFNGLIPSLLKIFPQYKFPKLLFYIFSKKMKTVKFSSNYKRLKSMYLNNRFQQKQNFILSKFFYFFLRHKINLPFFQSDLFIKKSLSSSQKVDLISRSLNYKSLKLIFFNFKMHQKRLNLKSIKYLSFGKIFNSKLPVDNQFKYYKQNFVPIFFNYNFLKKKKLFFFNFELQLPFKNINYTSIFFKQFILQKKNKSKFLNFFSNSSKNFSKDFFLLNLFKNFNYKKINGKIIKTASSEIINKTSPVQIFNTYKSFLLFKKILTQSINKNFLKDHFKFLFKFKKLSNNFLLTNFSRTLWNLLFHRVPRKFVSRFFFSKKIKFSRQLFLPNFSLAFLSKKKNNSWGRNRPEIYFKSNIFLNKLNELSRIYIYMSNYRKYLIFAKNLNSLKRTRNSLPFLLRFSRRISFFKKMLLIQRFKLFLIKQSKVRQFKKFIKIKVKILSKFLTFKIPRGKRINAKYKRIIKFHPLKIFRKRSRKKKLRFSRRLRIFNILKNIFKFKKRISFNVPFSRFAGSFALFLKKNIKRKRKKIKKVTQKIPLSIFFKCLFSYFKALASKANSNFLKSSKSVIKPKVNNFKWLSNFRSTRKTIKKLKLLISRKRFRKTFLKKRYSFKKKFKILKELFSDSRIGIRRIWKTRRRRIRARSARFFFFSKKNKRLRISQLSSWFLFKIFPEKYKTPFFHQKNPMLFRIKSFFFNLKYYSKAFRKRLIKRFSILKKVYFLLNLKNHYFSKFRKRTFVPIFNNKQLSKKKFKTISLVISALHYSRILKIFLKKKKIHSISNYRRFLRSSHFIFSFFSRVSAFKPWKRPSMFKFPRLPRIPFYKKLLNLSSKFFFNFNSHINRKFNFLLLPFSQSLFFNPFSNSLLSHERPAQGNYPKQKYLKFSYQQVTNKDIFIQIFLTYYKKIAYSVNYVKLFSFQNNRFYSDLFSSKLFLDPFSFYQYSLTNIDFSSSFLVDSQFSIFISKIENLFMHTKAINSTLFLSTSKNLLVYFKILLKFFLQKHFFYLKTFFENFDNINFIFSKYFRLFKKNLTRFYFLFNFCLNLLLESRLKFLNQFNFKISFLKKKYTLKLAFKFKKKYNRLVLKKLYIYRIFNFLSLSKKSKYHTLDQNFDKLFYLLRGYIFDFRFSKLNFHFKPLVSFLQKSYIMFRHLKKITIVPIAKNWIPANLIFRYITFNLKFKIKLVKIIPALMKQLLKFVKDVRGVKIICSGRFTRQQRAFYFSRLRGKLPLNTISMALDYHAGLYKSRYGIGCIKIWVFRLPIIKRYLPIFHNS